MLAGRGRVADVFVREGVEGAEVRGTLGELLGEGEGGGRGECGREDGAVGGEAVHELAKEVVGFGELGLFGAGVVDGCPEFDGAVGDEDDIAETESE